MAAQTAFQALIRDTADIACYMVSRYPSLPRMDSPAFSAALHEATLQYLASALQADPLQKQTVYQFAHENYPYSEDETKRKLYRHEKRIRKQIGRNGSARKNLYDPADFISIQNRSEKASALVSAVFRENIHLSKNFPGPAFAKAFADYDQEYLDAASLKDARDYLSASIYFYRMEHAMAFSLIANTTEYLAVHHRRDLDFNLLQPLWTDIAVPVADGPKNQSFTAWPNLLTLRQTTLQVLEGQEDPRELLDNDHCSRVLKQNILERLPLPAEKYGTFDPEEVASFIRTDVPIIESHVPVSFYLDDARTQINKPKIKLARSIMCELYTFAGPSQQI